LDYPANDWVMAVNFWGTLHMVTAFLPHPMPPPGSRRSGPPT
jgi:hypothetical protein